MLCNKERESRLMVTEWPHLSHTRALHIERQQVIG